MQKRVWSFSLAALVALSISGCNNGSTHNERALDTKALYEVAANDKLVIHIEDDNPQIDPDGSTDAEDNGNGDDTTADTETPPHENQPPVAIAHANEGTAFINVHVGDPVFFTSEGSNDPDGKIEKYIWTDMDDNVLSTDANFTRTFCVPAIYEKTLTVIDDKNASSHARVCILADITRADIALIAHAGPDIVTDAGTPVTIEGRAICKTGDFSYAWYENGELLSENATLYRLFNPGRHEVTLKITDNATGMYALDRVVVTVKEIPQIQGE